MYIKQENEGSNICSRRTQGRNRRARKANKEYVRGWRRAGEGRHRTQRVREGGTRAERAGGQKEIHGAEQEAREDMKIIRHPGPATEAYRRQKFFADALVVDHFLIYHLFLLPILILLPEYLQVQMIPLYLMGLQKVLPPLDRYFLSEGTVAFLAIFGLSKVSLSLCYILEVPVF